MKKLILLFALVAGVFLSASAQGSAPAQGSAASFPGGKEAEMQFLAKTVKYPASAAEMGIEGVVTVLFTVKADGTLTDLKIKRPVDPDLEAEALRVVRAMPKWLPAMSGGKAVDSAAETAITFRLK